MLISGINLRGGNYYGAISSAPVVATDPYFNYVNLLLPGNGANNAQNSTFVDESTNNFTITQVGNAFQGTVSPYGISGYSTYFDGTGDYFSWSGTTLTGDFTVEAWVLETAVDASGYNTVFNHPVNNNQLIIDYTNAGSVSLVINSSIIINAAGTAVTKNTWHHVAWVRQGSTCRIYVDGVQQGTGTSAASLVLNTIGAYTSSGYEMNGYISNARITNACLYPDGTTFTPSTTPLTTTVSSGTVQLLTCQSSDFKDNSTNAYAITVNGNTVNNNWGPFIPSAAYSASANGGSVNLDGTGDYLTAPSNTAFDFGSGNFTIEAWVYTTANATIRPFVSRQNAGGSYGPFALGYFSVTPYPEFYGSTSGSAWEIAITSSIAITLNSWNHVAITRNGTTFTLWVNGVSGGTATVSGALMASSQSVGIGGTPDGTYVFTGKLSNVRIVKGTAIYTSTFTPPTTPVTAVSGTSLLLNFSNAGIIDITTKNALEPQADAKISTTQSKWGGSSMYFDGTGDYLFLGSSVPPNLQLSTGDFTVECWVYLNGTSTYAVIGNLNDQTGTTSWHMILNSTYLGLHGVQFACRGTTFRFGTTTLATGTWQHVAVSCSGTSLKCFVDGTQLGTTQTVAASGAGTLTNPMWIGASYNNLTGISYAFNGYINDLRITKGIARYTTNFTPPDAAFPTY